MVRDSETAALLLTSGHLKRHLKKKNGRLAGPQCERHVPFFYPCSEDLGKVRNCLDCLDSEIEGQDRALEPEGEMEKGLVSKVDAQQLKG